MKLSRRSFLKNTAKTGAAASLASSFTILVPGQVQGAPSPLNTCPGRILLNYDDRTGATQNGGSASAQTAVKNMVDATIKTFTGIATVGDAWKSIFPTLTATTKILLKTNVNYPMVIPHPFVVKAILEGLMQMQVGGSPFPPGNLTVFDRNPGGGRSWFECGYQTGSEASPVNLFPAGTRLIWNAFGTTGDYVKWGDGADNDHAYSKEIHNADYIINLPSYKGHGELFCSQVTIAFKSHYGTYNNASSYHGSGIASKVYLREINRTGVVYNKQVLNILSNLFANDQTMWPHDGASSFRTWSQTKNPAYTGSASNAIAMSTDPVTTETLGYKILRINKGLTYGISDLPDYLRASAGIDVTGFTPTYNLGEIDESKWKYGEIVNGVVKTAIPAPCPTALQVTEESRAPENISVFPNPATPHASIDFIMPTQYTGQPAEIVICNMRGAVVRRFGQKVMGVRTSAMWDGRNSSGQICASGRYLAEVRVAGRKLMMPFTVTR